jgi:outer membrane receptor protein involved in Fe transport
MEFVNVGLFRSGDSSLSASAMSDKNGLYKFSAVTDGNYYLQLSFIGFETKRSKNFSVNGSPLDLGITSIKASGKVLGEVSITDEKAVMETSIDKKVYNVGKDIMSTSGSASEVLGNVPSVAVDVDGAVSLRGSPNVTILINGKPSPLMRKNAAATLQSIPANTIERIEIITNPSAKYKPDGTAGIINIILKKDSDEGFNGTLIGNASIDDRYNSTLSLNYKKGKMNYYGSYGYRQDYRGRIAKDDRIRYDSLGNKISDYSSSSDMYSRPYSHSAQLGIDYSIDTMNEIGFSGEYFFTDQNRAQSGTTLEHDSIGNISNDFSKGLTRYEFEWDKILTAHYEHKFKKADHVISADVEISDHFESENNKITESYKTPALTPYSYNNVIELKEHPSNVTLEYTYPVNEDIEIEAGYEGEYMKQDFNFLTEYHDNSSDAWIKDSLKSSHFKFDQQIHAFYLTYSQDIEDFSFIAGLRPEQVYMTSNLVTLDSVVPNNYFKLFPSLHLGYELSDGKQLMLSYSKRVNRMEGDEMNPFPEYTDPRNISSGNPKIKPEQIHSVELGYQIKNKKITFVPTLYYRYLYDAFTEVSKFINDSTILTSQENISSSQSSGLELVFSTQVKKILTVNFSANGYYHVIDASNLGYSKNKSAYLWDTKLSTNINATRSTMIQFNTSYRAAELTPQGRSIPSFVFNAGLRQDLFHKKASLTVTASDVFNTMRWENEINTAALYQKTIRKRKSQIVYVGFIWRFGRLVKRSAENLNFDDKM